MIDVCGVHLAYGAEQILEEVSFRSGAGEFLGIIGPNGSGKTTLLKAMSRVLSPSRGAVLLDGRSLDLFSPRELSRRIAVVPQAAEAGYDFTVSDVVMMGRYPHIGRLGKETAVDREMGYRAMEVTGVLHMKDRSVQSISGGELQRVIIARALAQEPKVLLLDEPTAHLDLGQQIGILQTMKEMSGKIAVIGVFHDLNYAAHYCDRLIALASHRVLAMGEPVEVLTPSLIHEAFGIRVDVRKNPATGRPFVVPLMAVTPAVLPGERLPRVHVICGGGSGGNLLPVLHAAGYPVTAGVLSVNDSDYTTAVSLGVPVISEPPFAPVSPGGSEELSMVLERTDAVVLTPTTWGEGNIVNLRLVEGFGGPVFLLGNGKDNPVPLDYTGGEAPALLTRLRENGAVPVDNHGELIVALARSGHRQ